MSWWKKFREFDRRGFLIKKVEGSKAITRGGYVFERWIFRGYMLMVVAFVLYIVFSSNIGLRELYLHCPADRTEPCENPLYFNCDREECKSIEQQQYLAPGFTLGRLPPPEYDTQLRGLVAIVIGGFLLAFSLNHWGYNRGRSLSTIIPENEFEEGGL